MRPLFTALLVAFSPLAAHGQVAPGAGAILQQVQPVKPPSASPAVTGLTIEQAGGAKLPAGAPFLVTAIRISGNTVFDAATLHALVAGAEGQSLPLAQLGELAARITEYYYSHGYPLARAIIPAQVIRDGVVQIEIIEARYGKIGLENRSRVSDSLLHDTLAPLQGGQLVEQSAMDHVLLLLSDIPGVAVNATLKPGEAVGTSDLLVGAVSGPAVSGNLALDNDGNRYTGRERIGATISVVEPLHHGDVLSLSALSSGRGMNYGRFGYDTLLNGQGTRLGGAWSALHYMLGGPMASLHAHGTAQVSSLWARHPLVRSRDVNLYGQLQYDALQLRDHVDASTIRTDRSLANWTVSLAGDARDGMLSGGITSWNVGATAGRVGFDDAAAQLADAASARTQGGFSKWSANLSRLQGLGPNNTLYLAFSGQWANANLDASQKMSAGGPYTVRAYDSGAVSGDRGYLGTVEFRRELGAAWAGQWQALAFIDSARVTLNQTAWAGVTGANRATLSGAGVGINWAGAKLWSAKASIAAPIGATPAPVGATKSARAWVEIGKGF